jgi:hypothetical protein
MKHLKSYKIFESESYQRISNIIKDLKDMCLELTDRGIKWHLTPSDDINVKVLGLKLFSGEDYPSFYNRTFFIQIDTRNIFTGNWKRKIDLSDDVTWFIDLLYQIESYMDSQGFKVNIGGHLADWIWSHSVEEFEDTCEGYFFRDVKIEFEKKK